MFTTLGYGATTTRAVAERAGMRQATMYHYVSGKDDLLAELLEHAVRPSLLLARQLLDRSGPCAEARLWQLCRADVESLCGGDHNLGVLYVLPEVSVDRFASFHRMRSEVKQVYGELLAHTGPGSGLDAAELALRTDLVLGLVEGATLVHRADPSRPVAAFAEATADAALRIAGVPVRDAAWAVETG